MIPKRLIFIWLGSELPEWGQFCMDNFKKVNPDFEIMFVYEPDMNNIKNQDVKDLQTILNNGDKSVYTYMVDRPYAKKHLWSDIGKITSLSDALRLYLLNKYGGIYLDLDTFPVKPFDEKILSYEKGFVINHDRKYCDFFFIGGLPNCIDDGMLNLYPKTAKKLFKSSVHRIRYMEYLRQIYHKKLKEISQKFYDCQLEIGEKMFDDRCVLEYYIDHFRKNDWKSV